MAPKIGNMGQDTDRFRKILHGEIRKGLRRYIIQGDIVRLPKGKNATIPMPKRIDLPRFHNEDGQDGIGQGLGEGEGGDVGDELPSNPAEHTREIEISVPELLDILAEDLALPNLEPKELKQIEAEKKKYNTRHPTGPRSLVHKRETLKRAILRASATGAFDPKHLVIEPPDFRYKSFNPVPSPNNQAIVFFLMDISGSISEEVLEIIRIESFWVERWIEKFYPKTVIRFIIHDDKASEVEREEFFTLNSGGGTKFLPAYQFIDEIIKKDYPLEAWNIYCFHWTDGDGFSSEMKEIEEFMRRIFIPKLNLFGYEQIKINVHNGQLIERLEHARQTDSALAPKMRLSELTSKYKIIQTIKKFFGKSTS